MSTEKFSGANMSRRDFIKSAALGVMAISSSDSNTEISQAGIENKFINKNGNCEFVFTSSNPKEAHLSANKFADGVGNALKAAYPSKIADVSVTLKVLRKGGQKLYRLVWKCKIVKSSVADAHYRFDHRGTMWPGRTLALAKYGAEDEIKRSGKKDEANSGNFKAPFIRDSFAGSNTEGYWYIKEFFMVAPK